MNNTNVVNENIEVDQLPTLEQWKSTQPEKPKKEKQVRVKSEGVKLGRPVNPNSKAQLIKLKREQDKLNGIVPKRTGRPINPNSKAQLNKVAKKLLIDSGEVIKRGRKPLPKVEKPINTEVIQ